MVPGTDALREMEGQCHPHWPGLRGGQAPASEACTQEQVWESGFFRREIGCGVSWVLSNLQLWPVLGCA